MRQIVSEDGNPMFDTKVHHVDPKTGKLVGKTPYRLVVKNGNSVFEDTISGIKYNTKGEPIEVAAPAPAIATPAQAPAQVAKAK